MTFISNGVPFIAFGFLDNFIMIVAGDFIDETFCVAFSLSTMCAAGFGNTLSDVVGIV
jgi:chitinase